MLLLIGKGQTQKSFLQSTYSVYRYFTRVSIFGTLNELLTLPLQSDCVKQVRATVLCRPGTRDCWICWNVQWYQAHATTLCSENCNCNESDTCEVNIIRHGDRRSCLTGVWSMQHALTYDTWWWCLQCAAQHSMSAVTRSWDSSCSSLHTAGLTGSSFRVRLVTFNHCRLLSILLYYIEWIGLWNRYAG